MSELITHREGYDAFVGRLFRWTLRASVAYVAAVAAAAVVWRLPSAWIVAAAIGVVAGAAGLYLRVRLLALTTRGKPAMAPLSVLAQLAALAAGLAAATAWAAPGFLAAAGGVVLANVLILVVGLRKPAGSQATETE